jgi:nitroimidazol reductase NimA-like FMN-containing flavoprotein (pyridoxamine 5'-phosphate oxidase superfamily)
MPAMKQELKRQIINLLDEHRIMTVATNRSDGWPQATIVNYANDGLVIYCFIDREGQKFANIQHDPRVSVALAKDYPQPLMIKGLSFAGHASVVQDRGEIARARTLYLKRHPEHKVLPPPDPAAVPAIRIAPEIVSIIDYSKGFGHSDLVRVTEADMAEFVEARRHHWAASPLG